MIIMTDDYNNYYPSPSSLLPQTNTKLEIKLLNYLMISMVIGLILFISNSCLISAIYINKDRNHLY